MFHRFDIYLGCSALDWDLAVMEEFRSQKCYSHMNNLQTTSRDTKDFPKVLRCVWINTNRQSVPVTPKARYFKKNLQHLLGAKWQRDLETQEELDKFLEIWCGDRINPCKKKLSGAEHTQRKFCVDFRAHEPGIFTFSPWKVCDFAKIESGILKVFFTWILYSTWWGLHEFCWLRLIVEISLSLCSPVNCQNLLSECHISVHFNDFDA